MCTIKKLREKQPKSWQSIERSSFIFLDIETTGLRPDRGARIIEIAIYDRNRSKFYWRHPKENLKDKYLSEQLPIILDKLKEGVVIGHNVSFDLRFIAYESERLGFRGPEILFIDTLSLAKKLCDNVTDFKLSTLQQIFEISIEGKLHTATVDVKVTRALFWQLVNLGNIETLAQAGMQRVNWAIF